MRGRQGWRERWLGEGGAGGKAPRFFPAAERGKKTRDFARESYIAARAEESKKNARFWGPFEADILGFFSPSLLEEQKKSLLSSLIFRRAKKVLF